MEIEGYDKLDQEDKKLVKKYPIPEISKEKECAGCGKKTKRVFYVKGQWWCSTECLESKYKHFVSFKV